MSFLARLHDAMTQHGFHIVGHVNPNSEEFQRFKSQDSPRKGLNIFVKLLDGGACFGDWRFQEGWITWWEKGYRELSLEEKEKRAAHQRAMLYQQELKRNAAKERAFKLWQHSMIEPASINHLYVKCKNIIPYYARQIRSRIVLPITDINKNFQSLQFIANDGRKRFKRGCSYKHGMLIMAEEILPGQEIRICEGWATACSIYEAFGPPVICAYNSDNLYNVTMIIRNKYTNNIIRVCADNDQWLKENVGLKCGRLAAKDAGAILHYPIFDNLNISNKPTDFNDLFCIAGLDEVENQLLIMRK